MIGILSRTHVATACLACLVALGLPEASHALRGQSRPPVLEQQQEPQGSQQQLPSTTTANTNNRLFQSITLPQQPQERVLQITPEDFDCPAPSSRPSEEGFDPSKSKDVRGRDEQLQLDSVGTFLNDILIADPPSDFSTLAAALSATGLLNGLITNIDIRTRFYTIFAPTNAAFDAFATSLGLSSTADLLDPAIVPTATVIQVLSYHFLTPLICVATADDLTAAAAYRVDSTVPLGNAPLTPLEQIRTQFNGADLELFGYGDNKTDSTALVTTPDLYFSNAIVHVVDRVLNPLPPVIPVIVSNNDDQFSILNELLQLTGLDDVLANAAATFTVFAPTDAAFTAAGLDVATLETDLDLTRDILLHHVLLDTAVTSTDIFTILDGLEAGVDTFEVVPALAPAISLEIGRVGTSTVTVTDGRDRVAQVIVADVQASNGIVHVVDSVLLPYFSIAEQVLLRASTDLGTLSTALTTAGLMPVVSDYKAELTVFAPDNDAFTDAFTQAELTALLGNSELLIKILTYHVTPGFVRAADILANLDTPITTLEGDTIQASSPSTGAVELEDQGSDPTEDLAAVTEANIEASNGVIHIIDKVLLPPLGLADKIGLSGLTLLYEALVFTELDDVLNTLTNTDTTVFAPTDAAFATAGFPSSASFTDANKATLTTILQAHVLKGFLTSIDSTVLGLYSGLVTVPMKLPTLNDNVELLSKPAPAGSTNALMIEVDGDTRTGTSLVQAEIIEADIFANNGLIHIIDQVIVPP